MTFVSTWSGFSIAEYFSNRNSEHLWNERSQPVRALQIWICLQYKLKVTQKFNLFGLILNILATEILYSFALGDPRLINSICLASQFWMILLQKFQVYCIGSSIPNMFMIQIPSNIVLFLSNSSFACNRRFMRHIRSGLLFFCAALMMSI